MGKGLSKDPNPKDGEFNIVINFFGITILCVNYTSPIPTM